VYNIKYTELKGLTFNVNTVSLFGMSKLHSYSLVCVSGSLEK